MAATFATAPRERKRRVFAWWRLGGFFGVACALTSISAFAADPVAPAAPGSMPTSMTTASMSGSQKTERLQVTDPYIELRTGPGRGFPVFFVTKRGDFIEIELRHTDWYRVKRMNWPKRREPRSTTNRRAAGRSWPPPSMC